MRISWRQFLVYLICLSLGLGFFACDGIHVAKLYQKGIITTAAPIASEVGREVFVNGGNAFDAAVASAFALAVVHPNAGNIGGGGFAVIRSGGSGEIRALDFRETAPGLTSADMYLDDSGDIAEGLSSTGALSAGVPGTVAGLYELWSQFGTMDWSALLEPAIALADTGFIIDDYLADLFRKYRSSLHMYEATADIFLPGDVPLQKGERLRQIDLAMTLRRIALEGPEGFYKGETAALIESTMVAHGGLISASDLAHYSVKWRSPIRFDFDSITIYSMPPPSSGGIVMAQIMKLIEPFDFDRWTPRSVKYMHVYTEMSRLAFADRATYLGDPDFVSIRPGLLDESYLNGRRKLVNSERATPSQEILSGKPHSAESDQTTHLSVADSDGNVVSLTYTINSNFGSKLVVRGGGFLLNNEMDDFSISPGQPNIYGLVGSEANEILPGKRMLSSMSPTIVLKGDQPVLAIGAMGGPRIISTVAQTLLSVYRFGLPLHEAIDHGFFHHQWQPDILYFESDKFSAETRQSLTEYGHRIEDYASRFTDVQAIQINDDGSFTGVSDRRGRGAVSGF